MAKLKDKIENGLNDVRILILGGQVLVGATFRALFEIGFNGLPYSTQIAELCALAVMLLGFGPLLLPAAFHRIAEQGEGTWRIKRLLDASLAFGLVPFAIGLAADVFMSAEKIGGRTTAWICATISGALAFILWYGIEYAKRNASKERVRREREAAMMGSQDDGSESLTDKIKQALTELRMVLPGTQALLGFQFVIVLMPDFGKVPAVSKWVHLASLGAIALSAILLITPASYHRIVERGEDSEEFHSFAGRILLLAMFFLGVGLAGDFYVVAEKIGGSRPIASCSAIAMFVFFVALWFGYPAWKRVPRTRARHP